MKFIGAAIKLILVLLAGLVGCLILFVVALAWSNSSIETENYACEQRRLEQRIPEEKTGDYHDFCMQAKGYRRTSACYSSSITTSPAYCYVPGWVFWRK